MASAHNIRRWLCFILPLLSTHLLLLPATHADTHRTAAAIAATADPTQKSCDTVCTCKWKGGKQTVECIDRTLITIPDSIDISTQVLDMSGNNLQILPSITFHKIGLVNLQKIYLRNCRIGQIDKNAFLGLTNLVELDLSFNLLTAIPTLTLKHIPSLRELTMASNPIQKVESNAFAPLRLTKLDLSHCDIQNIAPDAFKDLSALHSLKLNGNKLSELRPRTVETLRRLHNVELHDNPWLCDCRLRAAKMWLTENNIPYPVAPICSGGPERVIDRTFAELQVDDFACRPEIMPVARYIEATTGDNATIVCKSSAVPSANVNWYWNGRLLVNGSAFSSYQRVWVFEEGEFEKRSQLVLTNAQETDSSEFYCVADNRAGSSEANFTLHVVMRAAGMSLLDNGQIAGLTAVLAVVILFIISVTLFWLVRLKRLPFDSKTPGRVEVITSVSPTTNMMNGKPATGNVSSNPLDHCLSTDRKASNDLNLMNPLQKPPRLTDMNYSTSHYDANGSVVSGSGSLFVSPTASAGNNPDLINSAQSKRLATDELTQISNMDALLSSKLLLDPLDRPASGDYSRAGGCDSLYPSGLWTDASGQSHHQHHLTSTAQDSYLRRTASTTISSYGYTEKTPIMDTHSHAVNMDDETSSAEFMSRTFPRSSIAHQFAVAPSRDIGSSSGSGGVGGYPSDYGLPLVHGAEHLKTSRDLLPPAGMPSNAKTLRVWQRGGVPVLPPVTALKRALTSSRNSPDEGYQEGCGTDV